MLFKQIILCLCAATLATAVPIVKSEQLTIASRPSIIDSASDISATRFADDMEAETNNRLKKLLIPASMYKVEVLGSDKVKTRIRRGIFGVKCPVGDIKVHGRCMSCDDLGTC